MTETHDETFEGWAILELMGHRRLAGHLSEQEIGGASFIRIDVPGKDTPVATQFYSSAAVYCITPTSEDIARKIAARSNPAPVTRWELEPNTSDDLVDVDVVEDDDDGLLF